VEQRRNNQSAQRMGAPPRPRATPTKVGAWHTLATIQDNCVQPLRKLARRTRRGRPTANAILLRDLAFASVLDSSWERVSQSRSKPHIVACRGREPAEKVDQAVRPSSLAISAADS
jgi:hypothetical protein